MNENPIYYLMSSGISLTDVLRTHLYALACHMLQKKSCRKALKCRDGQGSVSTEGKTAMLGGISGTIFDATVESDEGTGNVRFIVRPCDADNFDAGDIQWVEVFI